MLSIGDLGNGAAAVAPLGLLDRVSSLADAAWMDGPGDGSGAAARRARNKLRIGNFVTFQGAPGLWGPACCNASLLAAAEINKRGGILGREIELVMYDAGGPIEQVTDSVARAVEDEDIDIVMGSHISAVRVALRNSIRSRVPYIYTPVYEGGERSPAVMTIGETPRWTSRPAIDWLAQVKKAQRWYLIGSDYVWPWLSHRAVKNYIADAGGQVVGEEFVPLGEDNHERHLERIRAARPDVVLISLIGTDSVTFNRAFAECGLAGRVLRLAGAMDETILLGIGAEATENLFCASGYFSCEDTPENDEFRAAYARAFGPTAPPVGSVGQSNYEGLRFLEAVAHKAQTLARGPLLAAAKNIVYRGARGPVMLRDGRARMRIHLAQADGLDFRLIRGF
ncbi:substrate-binding domain-containing protein [Rhodopseudomonas sp. HC1]|uniref:substrate-binding domain-containing protein n=1 Tax=Rhodopseudomonas infernalis TaxID=2897386 RepID=UPI001EE95F4D|nr:substrate-binding domain-containing protein [Rhodopseudomonas infernalis]MCG6207457.1 substrate-binding domain-containing protein [Rhodopseudomonas infernalis]